jgi:hypothetical protein
VIKVPVGMNEKLIGGLVIRYVVQEYRDFLVEILGIHIEKYRQKKNKGNRLFHCRY